MAVNIFLLPSKSQSIDGKHSMEFDLMIFFFRTIITSPFFKINLNRSIHAVRSCLEAKKKYLNTKFLNVIELFVQAIDAMISRS